MPKHITKEKKKQIVDFYKSKPMTIEYAAEQFNISIPSAIKILDEYRIKRYTKVKLFSPDLDEHYFDVIDTEAKAYFLGLIITDGCVFHSKNKQSQVGISTQECDAYILEKFKSEIKSNKNITSDGRGCSQINILSNGLVKGLKEYGVSERKSLNTIFPNNIKRDLYPHLIRGIFDGDGSVSYYSRRGRKYHTKAIRFCQGNALFLNDLVSFLCSECDITPIKIYKEKDTLWSMAYRKNESMIKIIDYMYKDASVYLTRKKDICDLVYKEIMKYGNTEITA